MDKFDLTYATVDSLSEGVGSSQIAPLVERLSEHGMKINLITFEKNSSPSALIERMGNAGVEWTKIPFGNSGPLGGVVRTIKLSRHIQDSTLVHARSDFPAVAARFSGQSRVLWDVRSLWADQRQFIEENRVKQEFYSMYSLFEELACNSSCALSTLTNAVVPVLEARHKNLPKIRTVVPTAVDLNRFKFASTMPRKLKGLYSGTFNKYYDLDLSRRFIEALRKMVDCDIGWARPRESQITSLNAGENYSFSVSHPEMANLMSSYSFGLSICHENAGLSLKAAMPTKIAEFLAIGRPVVVNAGLGDCDEIFKASGVGVVISHSDNLESKAAELIEICENLATPSRCRDIATEYFSLDSGIDKYRNIYQTMLSR
jgi:glycosyltransferase involved in cell wall biosynthesis